LHVGALSAPHAKTSAAGGVASDSHHVGLSDFEVLVYDAATNGAAAWTDSAGNYDLGGLGAA